MSIWLRISSISAFDWVILLAAGWKYLTVLSIIITGKHRFKSVFMRYPFFWIFFLGKIRWNELLDFYLWFWWLAFWNYLLNNVWKKGIDSKWFSKSVVLKVTCVNINRWATGACSKGYAQLFGRSLIIDWPALLCKGITSALDSNNCTLNSCKD